MSKTAILTFHRGPNHGGYLQARELCRAVRKLGGEPEIIDYQNAAHALTEKFRPWVYRRPSTFLRAWSKHRTFRVALNKLPLSDPVDSLESVDWTKYASVIVGSDVVWDFHDPRFGRDRGYFGSFRNKFEGILSAFAASGGTVTADAEPPNWVRDGLRGFDQVAVRDPATAAWVGNARGVRPQVVVDPTWLAVAEDLDARLTPERYIAVYAYRLDEKFVVAIRNFARERDLKIHALGYHQEWADKSYPAIFPDDWIEAIASASALVTGTFHGALFGLRFGVPMAIVPNEFTRLKLEGPLRMVSGDSLIAEDSGDLDTLLDREGDLACFRYRVMPEVERSWNYLRTSLAPNDKVTKN